MRCYMNGCGPGVPAFLALTQSTCYEGLCQNFTAKRSKRLRSDAIHMPSKKEVVPWGALQKERCVTGYVALQCPAVVLETNLYIQGYVRSSLRCRNRCAVLVTCDSQSPDVPLLPGCCSSLVEVVGYARPRWISTKDGFTGKLLYSHTARMGSSSSSSSSSRSAPSEHQNAR
jgi:hypothetical protein